MYKSSFVLFVILSLYLVTTKVTGVSKPYVYSFSSAGASNVQVDFDIVDSMFHDPLAVHQLVYRDQSAASWSMAGMSLLYQTCTTYTYSTTINYIPPSGTLEWYLRSEVDSAVVTQSPKNVAGTFPVPSYLLADLGADPVGDTVGAMGSWLDITGCQASYSDTKLFFRLTNNGGGFPTSSGLTFFLYSVGIIDPDETDSVGYAVIYVNVPLLLSAGLYKINPVDTSFTKIGNITTNITANALSFSCNISDLTAQPGWSAWPPPSGYILTAPLTATQTLSGLTPNDIGKGAVFLPESKTLNYSSNSAPTIASSYDVHFVTPDTIYAQAHYFDPDDNCPTIRRLHLESTPYDLEACGKEYLTAGADFYRVIKIDTSGCYHFYFEFSDGVDTVYSVNDSICVTITAFVRGDVDGNGIIDISDVVYLISYIFTGGPAPNPLPAGDADCDNIVDISDCVFLIAYIFSGGPPPCV